MKRNDPSTTEPSGSVCASATRAANQANRSPTSSNSSGMQFPSHGQRPPVGGRRQTGGRHTTAPQRDPIRACQHGMRIIHDCRHPRSSTTTTGKAVTMRRSPGFGIAPSASPTCHRNSATSGSESGPRTTKSSVNSYRSLTRRHLIHRHHATPRHTTSRHVTLCLEKLREASRSFVVPRGAPSALPPDMARTAQARPQSRGIRDDDRCTRSRVPHLVSRWPTPVLVPLSVMCRAGTIRTLVRPAPISTNTLRVRTRDRPRHGGRRLGYRRLRRPVGRACPGRRANSAISRGVTLGADSVRPATVTDRGRQVLGAQCS